MQFQQLEIIFTLTTFAAQVLKKRHAMDCFSFIRLVNFIRSQNPSPDAVMKMTSDAAWSDDAYMKPVIPW